MLAGVVALAMGATGAIFAGARLLAYDGNGGLRHLQILSSLTRRWPRGYRCPGDDPSTFTVYVTITHRDRTSNCGAYRQTTQLDLGEPIPNAAPDGGTGSWTCNWVLLISWTEFW